MAQASGDGVPVTTGVLHRPASVRRAAALSWAVIGLFGLAAVLTAVFRSELIRTWAEGNTAAEQALAEGGITGLEESSIIVPAFVPIAVVSFVVVLMGGWVLVALFRSGYDWARWGLIGLLVFAAFATAIVLTRQVPVVFIVLAVVAIPVQMASIYYLLHRDTNRFVRGL